MNVSYIDKFIELIPDIAFFKNVQGKYIYFNDVFLNFVNKEKKDVINKTVFDFYSNENAIKCSANDKTILAQNKNKIYEEVFKKDNEDDQYFLITKKIIYDDEKNQLGLFCILKDITIKKQYEFIYEDNNLVLEYIAMHDNLTKVLDKIVHLAEERNNGSICSILLLDKKKQYLLGASSPSLPDFYKEAIDGIEIGEKVGSCGSATFKKERVIIENMDTHENWQPYLGLTQKANLHACWSEPIFSSKDEILGSFAIYNTIVKSPSDFELKLISSYAHLASIAIEKEYNNKLIKVKEQQVLEQTKITNKKLKIKADELSQLFDNALTGLMYITKDRVLIKGNQRLADILGYDNSEEMIGISMSQLHLSEDRFIEFGKTHFDSLKYKEKSNIEYQLQKKDGSSIWCELSGKVIDERKDTEFDNSVLWVINDISKRKEFENKAQEKTKEIEQKNEQLKDVASKDYLTGLYNRIKSDKVLEYQLKYSKRYNNIFGAILIDIDFFKDVNDTYGHQVGDIVLCEFANLLQNTSRETDIVARWGGEEFLIVVKNINKESISSLAEKLRVRIESHEFFKVNHITASFGVAIYRENDTMNKIISRVDEALYKSKHVGRNTVSFV